MILMLRGTLRVRKCSREHKDDNQEVLSIRQLNSMSLLHILAIVELYTLLGCYIDREAAIPWAVAQNTGYSRNMK